MSHVNPRNKRVAATPSYGDDHEDFRASFRSFLARHATPYVDEWEVNLEIPRELFRLAGQGGFLGMQVPEEYGGAGVNDFRFNAILAEECYRIGSASLALSLTIQNDVVLPYLLDLATEEQKTRWLPGVVTGEFVLAVAMTEPGAGSDLAALSTLASLEGNNYRVNGSKIFITNGMHADLVVTAVRTDVNKRHAGVTLVVIERGMEGFSRGKRLSKIGLHAQDTAELVFEDVLVPLENRLGPRAGDGFLQMAAKLPQERLTIAVGGVAAARSALEWTIEHVRFREAFGAPLGALQNTRFTLAECAADVELGQAYVERCMRSLADSKLSAEEAAVAKLWCTEMQGRVIDKCLQLFGGYGYMNEYPIARAFADARVTRIYGGANEIMKEIIGRSLDLSAKPN